MKKLKHRKDAKGLATATVELLASYKEIHKTIITDNGYEFYSHKTISEKLEVTTLFRRSVLIMAKGNHRECQWTHKTDKLRL